MPLAPRGNKPGRLVWLSVAMTALAASLALVWHVREPELLAERYAAQLVEAAPAEVEPLLTQIAALGDAGLPVLADALASRRPEIRDASRHALLDEVNRWELLTAADANARLQRLARLLARKMPDYAATNRKFAGDLALRALDWPHDEGAAQPALLADCEAVLQAAGARRGEPSLIALATAKISPIDDPIRGGSLVSANLTADEVGRVAALPGGALPVEPLPLPRFDGFIEPIIVGKTSALDPQEPQKLPDSLGGRPLRLAPGSGDPLADSLPGRGLSAPGMNQPRRLPTSAGSDSNMRHLAVDVVADAPIPNDTTAWHRLKPLDVMRQLHVKDPRVVAAARVELEHRGVTGSQVDVARLATDPDPQIRRALAEQLPSIPGIDAKPWLLELSSDADPQVRATAVTLMATSGDLELLKRIEQISRDDPDDYTRAQALKALPPRARDRE